MPDKSEDDLACEVCNASTWLVRYAMPQPGFCILTVQQYIMFIIWCHYYVLLKIVIILLPIHTKPIIIITIILIMTPSLVVSTIMLVSNVDIDTFFLNARIHEILANMEYIIINMYLFMEFVK